MSAGIRIRTYISYTSIGASSCDTQLQVIYRTNVRKQKQVITKSAYSIAIDHIGAQIIIVTRLQLHLAIPELVIADLGLYRTKNDEF